MSVPNFGQDPAPEEVVAWGHRAKACPDFRWLGGEMQLMQRDHGGWTWYRRIAPSPSVGTIPDYRDAAALGCLVALVREVRLMPLHGPTTWDPELLLALLEAGPLPSREDFMAASGADLDALGERIDLERWTPGYGSTYVQCDADYRACLDARLDRMTR